jgi:hypothetical protein
MQRSAAGSRLTAQRPMARTAWGVGGRGRDGGVRACNCESAPAVPKHSSAVPQPSSAVPQPSSAVPQHSSAVPQHSSVVPQHSPAVPQHSPAVPQHSPPPSCSLALLSYSLAVPWHSWETPSYWPFLSIRRRSPSYSPAIPVPTTPPPAPHLAHKVHVHLLRVLLQLQQHLHSGKGVAGRQARLNISPMCSQRTKIACTLVPIPLQ